MLTGKQGNIPVECLYDSHICLSVVMTIAVCETPGGSQVQTFILFNDKSGDSQVESH